MDRLSDRELLTLALGTPSRRPAAHTLAEQLLARYGSLRELAGAHHSELALLPGIGAATAYAVAAVFELARRLPARHLATYPMLGSTNDLRAIVNPLLHGRNSERLVLLVCNARHRIIHTQVLADGLSERVVVPVRDILTTVLRWGGTGFALAHNHPNGNPQPSTADVEATAHVAGLADQLGLELIDHIVVTDDDWRRVPQHNPTSDVTTATTE